LLKKTSLLHRALASCWRVVIGVCLFLFMAVGVTWWLMPDVNSLKPEIESWLKQSMHLESLELHEISWSWHDKLVLQVEDVSFAHDSRVSPQLGQSVKVRHTTLYVDFSLWNMVSGDFIPRRIFLRGGTLDADFILNTSPMVVSESATDSALHTSEMFSSLFSVLPNQLGLEDMQFNWRIEATGDVYQVQWEHVNASVNKAENSASLTFPGVDIDLGFDDSGRAESLSGQIEHLNWLPDQLTRFSKGSFSSQVLLKREQADLWSFALTLDSENEQPVAWAIDTTTFALLFNHLQAQGKITSDSLQRIEKIDVEALRWKKAASEIHGSAIWQQGQLTIQADSEALAMPDLWAWLQPLDETPQWSEWLLSMKAGVASNAMASVTLPWDDLEQGWPTSAELERLAYKVSGHVDNVDIRLGLAPDYITRMRGDVRLDQDHLHADFTQGTLPHAIGEVQGSLEIPWNTLILDIKAQGNIRADLLQNWLDTDSAKALDWVRAPSQASASIIWDPGKDMPDQVHISLIPSADWQLQPNKQAINIKSGSVEWDLHTGIQAQHVKGSSELFEGDVSFATTSMRDQGALQSVEGNLIAELDNIVQRFRLPIENPQGSVLIQLKYIAQQWQGDLDLTQASWDNLMGYRKETGRALHITFTGKLDAAGYVNIQDFSCDDQNFSMRGSGHVGEEGLKLKLTTLKTEKFNGSLAINGPFGQDPWEIDVDASFLDRRALPEKLEHAEQEASQKSWVLRADIDQFRWTDAMMFGVHIDVASATGSSGVLKASKIDSGAMHLRDVKALFALPGEGVVDLRELSADMDQQHLLLSATLRPEDGGGMRWQGFAILTGVFGSIMKRAELTQLFEGGKMSALFSGQGVLLRDAEWWDGLQGRLRLRVDDGVIRKGGTLTKLLAALSLTDLPKLLIGDRKDLTTDGLLFKRLQIQAFLTGKEFDIRNLAFRSSAIDIAGQGKMDLATTDVEMIMVARPFQNIDALLSKIPLLRDIIGGAAHSFKRKIYRMHGPVADAQVDSISAKEAGLADGGLIESLLDLPARWFDSNKTEQPAVR